MKLSRDQWPVSRDFNREIPKEERRVQVFATRRRPDQRPTNKPGRLEEILNYSKNLLKVKGIVGRLIRASQNKNLKVDDICLLKYTGKVRKGVYRLCRVTKMFEKQGNLVVRDVHLVKYVERKPTLTYCPEEPTVKKTGVCRGQEETERRTDHNPQLNWRAANVPGAVGHPGL